MIDRWTSGDPADLRRLGLDRDRLLADTRAATATSRPACEQMVDWFMESVAGV